MFSFQRENMASIVPIRFDKEFWRETLLWRSKSTTGEPQIFVPTFLVAAAVF
jgi:hypothetical protein